ncbi:pyridoxamine 5'-phosphate oxidase family protein [Jiangella gansuensis]|uniref:pyridoxamine 5'-phosphate oxidase family protein n=1 Tax=Jiangella gansuensis TaxID=281473 RepID=UPI0004B05900|nr:pyridoxamine 5'-phosphate oxidase family protein [Jiangella gansuensis]
MSETTTPHPADVARRIVDANAYLTLATVDPNGQPWATPVWFAHDDYRTFFWVSRPGTRHSQNIDTTAAVGIVIFDSTLPSSQATAVYLEAVAEEVPAADRTAALAVFNDRSLVWKQPPWQVTDVTEPAPHRLYRATAKVTHVLGAGDKRVEVTL